jgi:hypothetical protein
VRHHRLELAGRPGRPVTARGLDKEEQSIHTLMISRASCAGLPLDPLNLPLGDSSLPPPNPSPAHGWSLYASCKGGGLRAAPGTGAGREARKFPA